MEISCRYIHFIQTFKIMGSPHSLPLSGVDRKLKGLKLIPKNLNCVMGGAVTF